MIEPEQLQSSGERLQKLGRPVDLAFDPVLPDDMKSLGFSVNYKDCLIRVTVRKRRLEIEVRSRKRRYIDLLIFGHEWTVASGKKHTFRAPKARATGC